MATETNRHVRRPLRFSMRALLEPHVYVVTLWQCRAFSFTSVKRAVYEARTQSRLPCDWCGLVRRGISACRCCMCELCCAVHYCSTECRRVAWDGGHWVTKVRSSLGANEYDDIAEEAA